MRRRTCLLSLALPLAPLDAARADGFGLEAARIVEPDGPVLTLARFRSAGGALERFTSRPGAWYALLLLPLLPGWPVELSLRAQRRGHALAAVALDAPPDAAPSVAVALPLRSERAHPPQWAVRLALPLRSAADAVFVLLEQWRADFAPPPPLQVRLRTGTARDSARAPWWDASASTDLPPPSPLAQGPREAVAFELPIWGPRRLVQPAAPAWVEVPR